MDDMTDMTGMAVVAADLMPLPPHPGGVPWPTGEWPDGTLGAGVDRARLEALLGEAFAGDPPARLGETHAVLVAQRGRIVLERYWTGFGPDRTYPSWSMAKSITHALIGILVRDGKLDVHAPADVPEWQDPDDPRRAITLDQLLRMSSGLAFREDYDPDHPSDVIEMLFGSGQDDVAAFAATFPLDHKPDSFFNYSSGTSNIVARIAARALDADASAFEAFMRRELFDPIGMASALPKFDAAGTFIGSSFCFATARDFARFGTLYLRDGAWDGRRILPEGWVDYARTPTAVPPDSGPAMGYGASWWLGLAGPHSFSANGYDGQYTVIAPELDLVLVRHGKSEAQKDDVRAWIGKVIDCFRV